ncbi:MAG: molybdopterin molybdotransferase MoeA [Promethearchaeota archaeon]|jgi:molybdenum cofactor synthesis domain-containing protein
MEKLRRIGFSKLTPVEEALEKLFSHIIVNPYEEIDLTNVLNRVLATDIVSEIDLPPFNRSAMDGYAIQAEDSFGASTINPKEISLVGTIEIGESTNLMLNKGEGIRISTGAPIPTGANSVVKIEDTEIENNLIKLYISIPPGKNISKKGEDIKIDTQVLNKGIEIKAEHIALLTSLGFNRIKVVTKPKVSVFSSGDELLEPGDVLLPGKIYNSNTPMISALVQQYGGEVIRGQTVEDDKRSIKRKLIEAAEDSQIVIFTGGTSVGTKDYLPEVIKELGTIIAHGIAQRPGAPVLIGLLNEKLIFCLPGTPVAAYVSFLKIAGIAIRGIMGCTLLDPRSDLIVEIGKDVPVSGLGYLHHLRVKIEKIDDKLVAFPKKLKGSGVISSLTESDGIVEIPPYQEGLKKGEKVVVKLFPK